MFYCLVFNSWHDAQFRVTVLWNVTGCSYLSFIFKEITDSGTLITTSTGKICSAGGGFQSFHAYQQTGRDVKISLAGLNTSNDDKPSHFI